jgi:MFS family permease
MFNVILLGITSLLTDISSEMVYPLLPLYLTIQLGASPAILGLIEGIAESIASLLKVFSGALSDKFRRRKPLTIIGYSFSTVAKFFLYISKSWGLVLVGRVIDRFGKGVRTAPRDALIADSTAPEVRGKAYGLHRAMDSLGAAVGVLAAYFLFSPSPDKSSYNSIFLLSLIPAAAGVIMLFFIREKTPLQALNNVLGKQSREAGQAPTTRPFAKTSVRALIEAWKCLDKKLRAFLIVTFIFTLGNSSNMFILLRAKNLGFDEKTVILLYLLYNVVYAVSSYPAGYLSDKIGRKTFIVAGYFFYGIVYFALAAAAAPGHVWLIMAVYGLYIGLTEGVEKAFVSNIAPAEKRATLLGLHATIIGIGLFPASLIAGLLWNALGPAAAFYFGSLMGFASALGFLIFL